MFDFIPNFSCISIPSNKTREPIEQLLDIDITDGDLVELLLKVGEKNLVDDEV